MTNNALTLQLLNQTFAIHSLAPDNQLPAAVFEAPIYFIAKTFEEISVVLPQEFELPSDDVERDWQALEVVGPLDFTLTGILSRISSILANEKISIFAISTFDTDYILVKENNMEQAISALRANQYKILRDSL
ncbi:ACT domain-containing protein [Colwellia sp. MEBiC06753]